MSGLSVPGVRGQGRRRERARLSPKIVHLIAAARPNFMKVAPLYHALLRQDWCQPRIVHTGQHYDANMSEAFFRDLLLPEPAHHLGVGSGTHAEQTGRTMIAYEQVCQRERPDAIVVVGDVNATAACAPQPSTSFSTSAVFSRMSGSLPRDSTLRRTSGSVLEPRRLKRHCSNSIDSPSVKSIASAIGS